MKSIRKYLLYIVALAVIFIIFAFGWIVSAVTSDYEVAENVTDEEIISMINSADEVYLHRDKPSLTETYSVVVDGKKLGTIKSDMFYLFFNKTYKFTSVNGNYLFKTNEDFHLMASTWKVVDIDNKVLSYISYKLSVKKDYNIYSGSDTKLGTLKTNLFSLFGNATIRDTEENKIFDIKKDIIGSTTVTVNGDTDIDNISAMMMVVGFNDKKEKNNNSSKSTK